MSYSWIGSPVPFNGTDEETGGDSGMIPSRLVLRLCNHENYEADFLCA